MKQISDVDVARKMVQLSDSARDRGKPFNLTFATVKKILTRKTCYYTGEILTNESNSPNQRTVDRIDASKGYIEGNVVACTKDFNQRKGNLTIEDIAILAKKCL